MNTAIAILFILVPKCAAIDINSTVPTAAGHFNNSIINEGNTSYITKTSLVPDNATFDKITGYIGNSTEPPTKESVPVWRQIMDILPAISLVGVFLNLLTLVTLTRDNVGLSTGPCMLLRHQSTVDAVLCLLAFCLSFPPAKWTTGILKLDIFICHLWHSQAFYWQW